MPEGDTIFRAAATLHRVLATAGASEMRVLVGTHDAVAMGVRTRRQEMPALRRNDSFAQNRPRRARLTYWCPACRPPNGPP